MKLSVMVFTAGWSIASAGQAQVTQTYAYDAQGRLTGVSTTGSGAANTAVYVYDDADNRMQRVQSGSSSYAALTDVPVGGVLEPVQALVSPSGEYTFASRPGGRLEVWRNDVPAWTWRLESDGPTFEVSDTGAARLSGPAEAEAARLSLRDDGRLALGIDGRVLWLSETVAR